LASNLLPLFEHYPALRDALPRACLGVFPTPVEEVARLGASLGIDRLFVKRDDSSGLPYGGNKVRKLEFLLGEARVKGAREVLTFGCAGSNHATATAVYARELGMRGISMLLPQPNALSVRRNLLLSYEAGAELHHFDQPEAIGPALETVLQRHRQETGVTPEVIPAGGSSPLGCVGYVNAAFEFAQQVRAGKAPRPDVIYVAGGTCGTAAGLELGLWAAELPVALSIIRVTDERFANRSLLAELTNETATLLHEADGSFPKLGLDADEFDLRGEFLGEAYGLYTEESAKAVAAANAEAGLKLEGTYTGKALAALAADASAGRLRGKTVLFWNTYNSRNFTDRIRGIDYRSLPPAFHRYFEEPPQPLDA
jgi:D-cysteine desulfhydrase